MPVNNRRIETRYVTISIGASGRRNLRIHADGTNPVNDDGQLPRHRYAWQLIDGLHRPLCRTEEAEFIADLRQRAGKSDGTWERSDLTALLNGLRCGATSADLCRQFPGVTPAAMIAAYDAVDQARRRCVSAWERLAAGDDTDLVDSVPDAVRLLPGHLRKLVTHQLAERPEQARATIRTVLEQSRAARHLSEAIESELLCGQYSPGVLVELGRVLYDPYAESVWGDPCFIPDRVGAVIGYRIKALVGDRRTDTD
jgi:hypothetical protein